MVVDEQLTRKQLAFGVAALPVQARLEHGDAARGQRDYLEMAAAQSGRLAFERARDAGKPLPVAITLGQGPAVFLAAQMPLPPDVNEFEFAGYLQGSPVPVARGAVTGLPIPANAEICLGRRGSGVQIAPPRPT